MEKGHEIAFHGYIHEDYSRLSKEEALLYLDKGLSNFKELGISPKGFRAPYWRLHEWLLELLVDKKIEWDSSLMDNDTAYIMSFGKNILVELPVSYVLDDWVLFEEHYLSYDSILKTWIYEYESILEENGTFVLTLHPSVIGRKARIKILEKLLIRVVRDNKSWIATGYEISKWVRKVVKSS